MENNKRNIANELIFSEDGKSVWIEFVDTTESPYFYTKEEAISSLIDYRRQGKISRVEEVSFIKKIIFSINLKWSSISNIKTVLISMGMTAQKIEKPYFDKDNDEHVKPHGYFYNGDNQKLFPFAIYYQEHGLYLIDLLYESEQIDKVTRNHLKFFVKVSKIPIKPEKPVNPLSN